MAEKTYFELQDEIQYLKRRNLELSNSLDKLKDMFYWEITNGSELSNMLYNRDHQVKTLKRKLKRKARHCKYMIDFLNEVGVKVIIK